MGQQKGDKGFVSEDRKKMGSFYSFQMNEDKLTQIKKRSGKQIGRFAITGLIFGFFTEWLLGNGRIYDNIIKKSTMRRLKAKKKEDLRLEERAKLRQRYAQGDKLL